MAQTNGRAALQRKTGRPAAAPLLVRVGFALDARDVAVFGFGKENQSHHEAHRGNADRTPQTRIIDVAGGGDDGERRRGAALRKLYKLFLGAMLVCANRPIPGLNKKSRWVARKAQCKRIAHNGKKGRIHNLFLNFGIVEVGRTALQSSQPQISEGSVSAVQCDLRREVIKSQ
jgi:hypothetical protein